MIFLSEKQYRLLLKIAADDFSEGNPQKISGAIEIILKDHQPSFRHLAPIIYKHLKKRSKLKGIASSDFSKLTQIYYSQVAVNLIYENWLNDFIKDSLPGGVTIILLKGAAFKGTIYAHDMPRASCDLDMLVKPGDFHMMCDVLAAIGREKTRDSARKITNAVIHERSFVIDDTIPIAIDLHHKITQPYIFDINYKDIRETSVPHPSYRSENVRVFATEDAILHQALHSYYDSYYSPQSIIDTFFLIKNGSPDFSRLISLAKSRGVGTLLYSLLRQIVFYLGDVFDKEILEELKPDKARLLLLDRLFPCFFKASPKAIAKSKTHQIAALGLLTKAGGPLLFGVYYLQTRLADKITRLLAPKDS